MATLRYSFLASLDGYIADPGGGFDWAVPDEEVLAVVNDLESDVGTYLYGRVIYQLMAGWENDPAAAAQSPRSAEFARRWQSAEKVVFSRTLEEVSTLRTRIVRTFDAEAVRDLKDTSPHDLSVSGADLAASAWRAGLVDECDVFVAPMLVGGGTRMFPADLRRPLRLREERRFGNGMVLLRYTVLHDRG